MLLVVVEMQQQLGHFVFGTRTGVPLVDHKLRHIQICTFALGFGHTSDPRLGRFLKQLLQRLREIHNTRKSCTNGLGCRIGTRLVLIRLRFDGRAEAEAISAVSVSWGSEGGSLLLVSCHSSDTTDLDRTCMPSRHERLMSSSSPGRSLFISASSSSWHETRRRECCMTWVNLNTGLNTTVGPLRAQSKSPWIDCHQQPAALHACVPYPSVRRRTAWGDDDREGGTGLSAGSAATELSSILVGRRSISIHFLVSDNIYLEAS